MNAEALLRRLLKAVGTSEDYFVSGSLSFLPLVPGYREPEHDVDIAISRGLFEECRDHLACDATIHWLSLADIAVANQSPLARGLRLRSSFVHVYTPDGLLDIACFERRGCRVVFRLGAGFTLDLPTVVLDLVRDLSWHGITYRAGPPELALIPKLVATAASESKHAEDLRRLRPVINRDLLHHLLATGGIRWMRRRLPRHLDPLHPGMLPAI